MTMAEFRTHYGHQASGLRELVDQLICHVVTSPHAPHDLIDNVNQAFSDLQSALMNNNLKDWYVD